MMFLCCVYFLNIFQKISNGKYFPPQGNGKGPLPPPSLLSALEPAWLFSCPRASADAVTTGAPIPTTTICYAS